MVNQGLGWAIVPEICLKNFKGQIKPLVFKMEKLLLVQLIFCIQILCQSYHKLESL